MSCGMPSTLPLSAYGLQSLPIAVPLIPAHPSSSLSYSPKYAEYFAKHPHLRDEYQISVQESERTSSRTYHHRMEYGICDEAQGTAFKLREIWEKASIVTVDDEAPSETTTRTLPAQPPTPPPRNPLRALLQPGTTSSSLGESSGFHTTSPTTTASSATTPPGTHTASCASSTPSLARSECRPPTSLLPPLKPLVAANEEISDSGSSSSHYSDSSSGLEFHCRHCRPVSDTSSTQTICKTYGRYWCMALQGRVGVWKRVELETGDREWPVCLGSAGRKMEATRAAHGTCRRDDANRDWRSWI
ncbi:hypothetical protein L198_06193 [Cryptococcus wingfieldii CBS 7118]|uniref:Uncharacterized protein n=1 Tax=Cryptococcus wingfieldii CBS 7118 TaxID=1295528 RepID=A0A1E3IP19_9TREE|nr:hypothetical protein L198_06193 [Cryptococcus wingfieldii CBS 7118]ODN90175.1 hypothetical protein L198_06193 [Cryptococcus wingfieldii CBS 7118]